MLQSENLRDELPIACKCGGATFTLRRGIEDYASMKRKYLPGFVDPTTFKLVAGCDACDSCRLTTGSLPAYWASALLKHLSFEKGDNSKESDDAAADDFPPTFAALESAVKESQQSKAAGCSRFGSLQIFSSSDDVRRYSCSICSASIFYTNANEPEAVDIAMGVLHAPDGARAESFLTWDHGTIDYKEDVAGGWRARLTASMERDEEEWRIEHDIPKCFRRLRKEQTSPDA